MRTRMKGFTLVEILIVVVILGILAAIVVPQFTNASSEAMKGALASQLQTINSQVELYRVRNQGAYPDFGGADNEGWGALVGGEYLKETPRNGYTRDSSIEDGGANDINQGRDAGLGWVWIESLSTVYAVGWNPIPDEEGRTYFFHENGFENYDPVGEAPEPPPGG